MLVQLSAAVGLIAATVAIQALFMSAGLHTLRWVDKHRPMVMPRRPTITTVIWVLFLMIPVILDCPSSDFLRQIAVRSKGGSGASVE